MLTALVSVESFRRNRIYRPILSESFPGSSITERRLAEPLRMRILASSRQSPYHGQGAFNVLQTVIYSAFSLFFVILWFFSRRAMAALDQAHV